MAPVVLHGFPPSTYLWTTRMACAEKGVAHEVRPIATMHSPEHLALHPFGKLPIMEHDGFRLFETGAICRYIDEAFDGPSLQPTGVCERAVDWQWFSAFCDYCYDPLIRGIVLPNAFPTGPDGTPDSTVIDAALPVADQRLAIVDTALSDRDWFAGGDAPSLADMVFAPMVFYLDRMPEGPGLLDGRAEIRRWFAAMAARETFKATLPPLRDG